MPVVGDRVIGHLGRTAVRIDRLLPEACEGEDNAMAYARSEACPEQFLHIFRAASIPSLASGG